MAKAWILPSGYAQPKATKASPGVILSASKKNANFVVAAALWALSFSLWQEKVGWTACRQVLWNAGKDKAKGGGISVEWKATMRKGEDDKKKEE